MYTLFIIPFEARTLSRGGKPFGQFRQSYGLRLCDGDFNIIASDFTLVSNLGSPETWDEGQFLNELNELGIADHLKNKRIQVMWYAHPHPWFIFVQSSTTGRTTEESEQYS